LFNIKFEDFKNKNTINSKICNILNKKQLNKIYQLLKIAPLPPADFAAKQLSLPDPAARVFTGSAVQTG
jgi:hypothetical protein